MKGKYLYSGELKKEWNNMKNFIGMCILCTALVLGLSGCGTKKDWVFSLHGEKINETELRAYGIIYGSEHNVANSEQLYEIYENGKTYEEYYKEQFSDEVVKTTLLYAEAKKEGYHLSKEQKKEITDRTESLVSDYSEEWLEIKNITKDDIENAFEKKVWAESYLESQTENEDAAKADREEENRYVRVYQVIFPTVKIDDEGMIVSDKDGEAALLPAEEREQKKSEAETFAETVKNGGNMEDVLKDYDNTVTGEERTLKYADLDTNYRQAIDAIDENEISGVIESDYGYYVIKLLEKDDSEHEKRISEYEKQTVSESAKDEVFEKLKELYAKDESEYRNSEIWDEISFSGFLK